MENNDVSNNNNNNKEERKNKLLEARRRAARAFHERNKDNEVYIQNQRENCSGWQSQNNIFSPVLSSYFGQL